MLINQTMMHFRFELAAGNPDDDLSFDEIACNLADAMSEKSELSAFSRKVIRGYGHISWVEELFEVA